MRAPYPLLALALAFSPCAVAEVRELDGEELVDAYVQGISIGQTVTDKPFESDDQSMRERTSDQQNVVGAVGPELSVSNAQALAQEPPVDELVAGIRDPQTRDLVEDAITQTSLSTRLDVNLDRITAETGIPTTATAQDFSVLRGTILELLPSTTGYQVEFLKDRF